MQSLVEYKVQAQERVASLGQLALKRHLVLVTAESCTGGLIGHWLTNAPGSSAWFAGAVVAYANQVKTRVLGVPEKVLQTHGAVSRETVAAMVRGACGLLQAPAGMAVSGIAGPDGGSPDKPVGTVWIAWALHDVAREECFFFSGSREQVKQQTALAAISGMENLLQAGA
jgi:nicotinamide-nucleotide amidase